MKGGGIAVNNKQKEISEFFIQISDGSGEDEVDAEEGE